MDFRWNFPDLRVNHRSVIGGWVVCGPAGHPGWAESRWALEMGGVCGVPQSGATPASREPVVPISPQLCIQGCHRHIPKWAMVEGLILQRLMGRC